MDGLWNGISKTDGLHQRYPLDTFKKMTLTSELAVSPTTLSDVAFPPVCALHYG